MNDDAPTTQELRAVQARVQEEELEAAAGDPSPSGEQAHRRRAGKAAYLADKLAEQQRADDES